MRFRVGAPAADPSTPPAQLTLPSAYQLPAAGTTRRLSLNEQSSATVHVRVRASGDIVEACGDPAAEPFGPTAALLGTLAPNGVPTAASFEDPVTEQPTAGLTEEWELYNFTEDAHPIHLHDVQFRVTNRQRFEHETALGGGGIVFEGSAMPPEPNEAAPKDTVIAYPEQVTRLRAHFDTRGLFVWHCHILEHEDNVMMRPLRVIE
jgi:bilirubin oxidase